jgi:ATP-dependent DNA helicase DinG
MMVRHADISHVFSTSGPLARVVDGFRPRPQQREMALGVARAMEGGGALLVEAGTGVGKTFAYLVPALLSGRRVIISTGTRSLQDQLFNRDLPTVSDAVGRPVKVAMLKGRSNYLCQHRLSLAGTEARFASRDEARWFSTIRAWAGRTRTGDVAEVDGVPEKARVWPMVTSTSDNCLGSRCESIDECHLARARREAMAADVVIVNHHLLLADMVLREEGFGQLLPGADAVIVDEAHQLPETAVGFFGVNVGSRQLDGLAADAVAEGLKAGLSLSELEPLADALTRATAEARLQLAGREGRQPWSAATGIDDVVEDLGAAVTALAESVRPMSQQEPGIEALIRRAAAAGAALETLAGREDEDCIRWFESFRRSFALHSTPVDVSEALGEKIRTQCGTWIFTSATLAVGDDFSHSAGRLGLPEADCLQLDSPFDFARQSRLFLPAGLPAPADPGYTDRVLDAVEPVLAASGGRAFLLFTSHRALRLAAERLRDAGPPLGDYPLLIQGDAPRDQLLQRFREFGNAILLGTSSFWEGVDVRGDALAVVVIDKLPFASPGDPLMSARLDAIRQSGGRPFPDFQLPQAVIALKQGVGRLIRDYEDRGIVVLCDPRLSGKSYGRVFLGSLPAMPITREVAEIRAFLDEGTVEVPA